MPDNNAYKNDEMVCEERERESQMRKK